MNSSNPPRRFADFRDYLEATRSDDTTKTPELSNKSKLHTEAITVGSVRNRILAFSEKQNSNNCPKSNNVHHTTSVNIQERMKNFQSEVKIDNARSAIIPPITPVITSKSSEEQANEVKSEEIQNSAIIDINKEPVNYAEENFVTSNISETCTPLSEVEEAKKCISFEEDVNNKETLGKYALTPMPSFDQGPESRYEINFQNNEYDYGKEEEEDNLFQMRKCEPTERLNTLEIESELNKIQSEEMVFQDEDEVQVTGVAVAEVEQTLREFDEKVAGLNM